MNIDQLYNKALNLDFLTNEEALYLYCNAPLSELMFIGNEIRKKLHPNNKVTWLIDRNVNITNVCVSQCQFCNFYRKRNDDEAYITSIDQYKEKIERLIELGGEQLLLQGGLHPKLGLEFYQNLFTELKSLYPTIKLHALGPPEIAYIAKLEKVSTKKVLVKLVEAGLDSLPGAGAEVLSDRVRDIISPVKCDTKTWLNVMKEAHQLNLITSATMMFGHIETVKERIDHLIAVRDVQDQKPEGTHGFIAFIPWPFQKQGTVLEANHPELKSVNANEYVRMIALSRIMLPNIPNIQASWLTVGKDVGQLCLHAGANDFGSIMIEENVVSSAGASHKMNAEGMQRAIKDAGYEPQLRNQKYENI